MIMPLPVAIVGSLALTFSMLQGLTHHTPATQEQPQADPAQADEALLQELMTEIVDQPIEVEIADELRDADLEMPLALIQGETIHGYDAVSAPSDLIGIWKQGEHGLINNRFFA